MVSTTRSNLVRSARMLTRDVIYSAGQLSVLGPIVVAAQNRRFNAIRGAESRVFNGVYPDFASARHAIPAAGRLGYDNEASATRVLGEWLRIFSSDYPVLFWLSQLLPDGTSVFDWGGNVGLKYFAFRKHLTYPASLTWCVSDVPAVVEAGREIARREGATQLHFTTNLDGLSNADILLVAGALQFIEKPLEMLRDSLPLPQHVILNKVPVYDLGAAVTLHNMGTAFCPYHLFNRSELVDAFTGLGYRLVDDWKSPEIVCEIPFYPEHSIAGYSGFYFTKRDGAASGRG